MHGQLNEKDYPKVKKNEKGQESGRIKKVQVFTRVVMAVRA